MPKPSAYLQMVLIANRLVVQRDNEAERGASIRMRMPEAWNAGRA
jgi:hypothetical protein